MLAQIVLGLCVAGVGGVLGPHGSSGARATTCSTRQSSGTIVFVPSFSSRVGVPTSIRMYLRYVNVCDCAACPTCESTCPTASSAPPVSGSQVAAYAACMTASGASGNTLNVTGFPSNLGFFNGVLHLRGGNSDTSCPLVSHNSGVPAFPNPTVDNLVYPLLGSNVANGPFFSYNGALFGDSTGANLFSVRLRSLSNEVRRRGLGVRASSQVEAFFTSPQTGNFYLTGFAESDGGTTTQTTAPAVTTTQATTTPQPPNPTSTFVGPYVPSECPQRIVCEWRVNNTGYAGVPIVRAEMNMTAIGGTFTPTVPGAGAGSRCDTWVDLPNTGTIVMSGTGSGTQLNESWVASSGAATPVRVDLQLANWAVQASGPGTVGMQGSLRVWGTAGQSFVFGMSCQTATTTATTTAAATTATVGSATTAPTVAPATTTTTTATTTTTTTTPGSCFPEHGKRHEEDAAKRERYLKLEFGEKV